MTEEQKYQGALYKEKQNKSQKNNANQKKNNPPQKPQQTNGERAPNGNASNSAPIPPPAPSPPLAPRDKPAQSTEETSEKKDVNVFDYLVKDESPNASRISLEDKPKEQMKMVPGAPSVFEPSKALARLDTDVEDEEKQYDVAYEENGFSYGADPIKPSLYKYESNISMDFTTPASKKKKDKKNKTEEKSAKSDKKRKRGHPDEQDSQEAKSQDSDTPMVDTPWSTANNAGTPVLKHSGLTGGLDRMMRNERVPSPDYEGSSENENQDGRRRYNDRQSPSKRTRRAENGLGISMKDGANKTMSMFGGSTVSDQSGSVAEPSQALQKVRRGSSDDESGKKSKKSSSSSTSKHNDTETRKSKRKISGSHSHTDARPSRRLKATESRDSDRSDEDNRKVIIYRRNNHELTDEEIQRQKAAYFLSLVNKGPESERGCSINKTLKRYHRDCPYVSEDDERESETRGRRRSRHSSRDRKYEEEKDLWRALRLKRNDRGEIVVFV